MSEKLGEALLDLNTNDKGFRKGVDEAERRANALGRVLDDVGEKARLLGRGLMLGAAVGFTAFGVGVKGAVQRLEEMQKLSAQVDRGLKNSGNTARTSAREIEAWADALEVRTGRAAEEVMSVSTNLASFGFGREQFFRALELANDMSAAWGGDLKQNLEGLARALDNPLTGMAMLSKRGIQLTDEQKQLAQAFLEAGDKASAQRVVFEALEAQVKGVAEDGFRGLSKEIHLAKKAWEEAFEDLVKGEGDAADLRDTLSELARTVSSPEFIRAVMGFGNVIMGMVNGIAQAVIAAWGKLQEFFNWLKSQQPANMGTGDIASQLAQARADLERSQSPGNAMGGIFGDATPRQILGLKDRIAELEAELVKRTDPTKVDVNGIVGGLNTKTFDDPAAMWQALSPGTMAGTAPYDPYEDFVYGGGGGKKQSKTDALIASLKAERDLMRELDPVKRQMISLETQLADAKGQQREEVENLIRTIHQETTAWDNAQAAAQMFGAWAMDSIEGLRKGTKSLIDVVGDLVDMLAQAVLQSLLLGQGPLAGIFGTANPMGGAGGIFGALAGLFAGGFYKGGLIPTGTFGIVGERGPEPVISTKDGAMVLPNSSLSSGSAGAGGAGLTIGTLQINGSGLSQSELTQAITDAFEHFSRFELPGRVASINADPLARG